MTAEKKVCMLYNLAASCKWRIDAVAVNLRDVIQPGLYAWLDTTEGLSAAVWTDLVSCSPTADKQSPVLVFCTLSVVA